MKIEFHMALLKAGISQAELSARVGIHPSSMSRIVCGWVIPSPEIQRAIRRALGKHGRDIEFGHRIKKPLQKTG